MIDLCKKCFDLNCVGSFFCDQLRPGIHLTGYIDAYNEDELVIKHISPEGYYDGFILVHMADVTRVDILGQYEKRIATLFSIRKQRHPQVIYQNNSFYATLMNYAHINDLIISIELEDATISGFVLEFNQEKLHIQVVDKNGQADGEIAVLIEDIVLFAIDTTTEQNLKLLNGIDTGDKGTV